MEEAERGRAVWCWGSWVWRRWKACGLPLRGGSRSPLVEPELEPLLRRLCRLVPRLILGPGGAAEPWPAAGGRTAGGTTHSRSESGRPRGEGGGRAVSGARGVMAADSAEEEDEAEEEVEEEEEEEEVKTERWVEESRLRCCWNSCLSP